MHSSYCLSHCQFHHWPLSSSRRPTDDASHSGHLMWPLLFYQSKRKKNWVTGLHTTQISEWRCCYQINDSFLRSIWVQTIGNCHWFFFYNMEKVLYEWNWLNFPLRKCMCYILHHSYCLYSYRLAMSQSLCANFSNIVKF